MHPLNTLIESQRREIHGRPNRPAAARSHRGRPEARTDRVGRVAGLRYAAPAAAVAAVTLARVLG